METKNDNFAKNAAGSPAVETRSLTRHFRAITAVESLDLSVAARSILGLLGPNGAGKTNALPVLGASMVVSILMVLFTARLYPNVAR